MSNFILAIDQGTTSSRSIVFDGLTTIAALAQREFGQHYPRSGWVEHDPEEIWESVVQTARLAIEKAGGASLVGAIGITNQRETTIVWDRATGRPIHNAIVWQDRRTADFCDQMKEQGLEAVFTRKTGLLLDPYFSGTKIRWLLDNVEGARGKAEKGELAFGTVDSWLIWKLTGGQRHVTDATNASRTLLFNIASLEWDEELLELMGVPASMMPEGLECSGEFGQTDPALFGSRLPITGVAGDQQAATIGQACFRPGMMKSTYGTGCFALLNTGKDQVASGNRLLTTIAYRLGGETTYALEGSIFIAGASVQWLRDGLRIIDAAQRSGELAATADPGQQVYLVPAFTGLGAPYWDAQARGALFGMTRNTGPAELCRAALEAVCYQTRDLLEAMQGDWLPGSETVLRVDGGMVASDWTMQYLADMLDAPVDRPKILETTALGAAWLAGSHVGAWPSREEFSAAWALDRRFQPAMESDLRERRYAGWLDAVSRTISQR